MKFGVIVCPACGRAKGVETCRKTTTCQCGREMKLSRIKIHYETDSHRELAGAVAQANSLLASGEVWPQKPKRKGRKGTYAEVARQAMLVKDPVERLTAIAQQLASLKGEFGPEDVGKVAAHMDNISADEMVARLQELGLVYLTADGRFRVV